MREERKCKEFGLKVAAIDLKTLSLSRKPCHRINDKGDSR